MSRKVTIAVHRAYFTLDARPPCVTYTHEFKKVVEIRVGEDTIENLLDATTDYREEAVMGVPIMSDHKLDFDYMFHRQYGRSILVTPKFLLHPPWNDMVGICLENIGGAELYTCVGDKDVLTPFGKALTALGLTQRLSLDTVIT